MVGFVIFFIVFVVLTNIVGFSYFLYNDLRKKEPYEEDYVNHY